SSFKTPRFTFMARIRRTLFLRRRYAGFLGNRTARRSAGICTPAGYGDESAAQGGEHSLPFYPRHFSHLLSPEAAFFKRLPPLSSSGYFPNAGRSGPASPAEAGTLSAPVSRRRGGAAKPSVRFQTLFPPPLWKGRRLFRPLSIRQ